MPHVYNCVRRVKTLPSYDFKSLDPLFEQKKKSLDPFMNASLLRNSHNYKPGERKIGTHIIKKFRPF